jgi:hypothetical protein
MHSPDGKNWDAVETGVKSPLWGVAFINELEGWAVGGEAEEGGEGGVILHIEKIQ